MNAGEENKDPSQEGIQEVEADHPKKGEKKIHGLIDFAKTNTKDSIAYIIMILGIILLFFEQFSGGMLIGIISGLYYSVEIQELFSHFNEFIDEQGIVRGIVLGVVAIALFISAPGIFVGALLAVIVKYLFSPSSA
ncbi:hypothetical protein DB42_AK00130 [Neochlamydia sp. EPS4]|uniref:hypothetical protein n=1 Tax=Neochlamydia sp. EPS4 TaxID=1478175 RepID=UPI000583F9E1|nr:hypothetical protein [Neochlamydia sp. EPS4]KIC75213.1 hypothetical protein DB42_AK00130 [Neochlamydia sp. EPS4]